MSLTLHAVKITYRDTFRFLLLLRFIVIVIRQIQALKVLRFCLNCISVFFVWHQKLNGTIAARLQRQEKSSPNT